MRTLNRVKVLLAGLMICFSSVAVSAPRIPTLSTPSNGQKNIPQANAKFTWSSSGAGVYYRIVISKNKNFSGYNSSTDTCNSTCVTGLAYTSSYTRSLYAVGQTYYWKVRAISWSGVSGWSGVRSFKTSTTPSGGGNGSNKPPSWLCELYGKDQHGFYLYPGCN